MTLPAALPLALWGNHFLAGRIPADTLIDHCGPSALQALRRTQGQAIGLAVFAPGDLANVSSPVTAQLLHAGSAVVTSNELLLAPDWQPAEGSRSVEPTRAESERLLIDALSLAHQHFSASPVFGVTPPRLPELDFPPDHSARSRELLTRAATTLAITEALASAWQSLKLDQVESEEILRQMRFAARRGFEAGVLF